MMIDYDKSNCFSMTSRVTPQLWLGLGALLLLGMGSIARADMDSARAAMEDPGNPLLLVDTSAGELYLELFPNEAPANVANFLGLAAGTITIVDASSNIAFTPRYYDGTRFHRVIPGFVIQAGSPHHNPVGAPQATMPDEINADFLGLNQQPVLGEDGAFNPMLNIGGQEDLAELILDPLYLQMDIHSPSELLLRQYDVLASLRQMSVKDVYTNQGYRFQTDTPSHSVLRGAIALANSGPGTNGPEFFIALSDAPWLTGRHTVIGQVVEGIEIADRIGEVEVDPLRRSRNSTVIYAVTRLN